MYQVDVELIVLHGHYMSGHRKRGRPKLQWRDVIQMDTRETQVQREEAQDTTTWRMKTCRPQIREMAKEDC